MDLDELFLRCGQPPNHSAGGGDQKRSDVGEELQPAKVTSDGTLDYWGTILRIFKILEIAWRQTPRTRRKGEDVKEAAAPSAGWSYHSSGITQNALEFHAA